MIKRSTKVLGFAVLLIVTMVVLSSCVMSREYIAGKLNIEPPDSATTLCSETGGARGVVSGKIHKCQFIERGNSGIEVTGGKCDQTGCSMTIGKKPLPTAAEMDSQLID